MPTTSTTSSNKRARSNPSSSSSKRPAEQPLIYHPSFPKTDLSDVLLVSSDECHLATSRIYLQASSSVFKDVLLFGTDESSQHLDGLVLIKLQETADDLSLFLSFVQADPAIEPPSTVDLATLDTLLSICDKFDAPLAGRAIARQFFPPLVHDDNLKDTSSPDLPDIFAVALIHSRFGTKSFVATCLELMGAWGKQPRKETKRGVPKAWRPYNLKDFDLHLLKRLTVEDIVSFSTVRMKVTMEEGYTWAQAAIDFKPRVKA